MLNRSDAIQRLKGFGYHDPYCDSFFQVPSHLSRQDTRPPSLIQATNGWKTNWNIHSVPYNQLSVVKQRDDIPSIDQPTFVTPPEAKIWLADTEPVVTISINGAVRAYPLQLLMWHEIINDELENLPIAITYCPLCNSAYVFSRQLNGTVFEFGTTGLLRFSNLVMYDRTTESLWQQFTGSAIVGNLTGGRLSFSPSQVISFKDFYTAHPEGDVLSRNTGFNRNYGQNPYVQYDQIGNTPFLYNGPFDDRLPALERVVGVGHNNQYKAYPFQRFSSHAVIQDRISGQDMVILFKKGMNSALDAPTISNSRTIGSSTVFSPIVNGTPLTFYSTGDQFKDQNTESTWNTLGESVDGPLKGTQLRWLWNGDPFWFAWAAFYPTTQVY